MADVAFKPNSTYTKELETKIERIGFINGLIVYGQRITASITGNTTGDKTVYLVPDGKVLFLITVTHNVYMNGTVFDSSSIFLNQSSNIISKFTLITGGDHSEDTLSFGIPIVLTSGEKIIQNTSNALTVYTVGITGYLVDRSVLPNFL